MTKPTIVAAGLIGAYRDSPHFVPTLGQGPFLWAIVAVVLVGLVAAAGGAIVQVVAWIGALVNPNQLQDKLWFALTLTLGLMGLGLPIMIAYLIAAPDGYEGPHTRVPPRPLAPTP